MDLELSEQVAKRLGLRQALVAKTDQAGDDPDAMRRQLGQACAALLIERLSADDVLGVSWGRTLHALTDVVPRLPGAAAVTQMVGSVPTADLKMSSLELLRQAGRQHRRIGARAACTDGSGLPGHRSRPARGELRGRNAGPVPRHHLRPDRHRRLEEHRNDDHRPARIKTLRAALPAPLVRTLDAAGAVADICSTVLDAEGTVVGGDEVPARCIAITTEQLHEIPDVIGLAGGADKAPAIVAAVRAGLLHRLITDTSAATAALAI